MALTEAIDQTGPLGTDAASGGAAQFRNLKRDISERMKQEHKWDSALSGTDIDGGHINITIQGALIVANKELILGSGYSLTGSDAHNMLDFTGTWNTSGAPTLFKVNVTNTASHAASLLLDLQLSTVSKFKVGKLGAVTITPNDDTTGLTIAGGSITGSGASSFETVTGTWNTSGAPTAWLLNVTNTASGAALLADWQIEGVSKFSVSKAGAIVVASTSTFADDIIFSADKAIRRNTSDGSDNGSLSLGLNDQTRGGYFRQYGNEHGATGSVEAVMGNVAGSYFQVLNAVSGTAFKILGSDGSTTFTSNLAGSAWTLNGTATNGGVLDIKRSGASEVQLGTRAQVVGTGSNNDVALAAIIGNLYLEGIAGGAHIRSVTVFNDTTASAANVFIDALGSLQRSTSSARYKDDIQDIPEGLAAIRKLRPVSFVGKTDPEGSLGKWRHLGFIAEEMNEVIPNLVAYKQVDGEWLPDHIEYDYLTAPIVKAIQELDTRLVAIGA